MDQGTDEAQRNFKVHSRGVLLNFSLENSANVASTS
jgi:hypothetical protein